MEKMDQNVVVALFKVESEGYQALSELRQELGSKVHFVPEAALVKKENGAAQYLDGFDTGTRSGNDTALGGLIGMTVGIIGGPLGMLLGSGFGTLVGANLDANDALFDTAMLEQIVNKLNDGDVALIALAEEENEDFIDSKLSKFDTVIMRYNAKDVEAEVRRAAEMQEEMARQAKLELRKEEKEKFQKQMEETKKEAERITEENKKLINDEFGFDKQKAEADKITEENKKLINDEFGFDKAKEEQLQKIEETKEEARKITEENKKLIDDEFGKDK